MSRIGRRQLLHGTLATAVLGAARPAPAQVGAADRAAMARAASAFVGVLDSGQRRAAMFPFAQDERMNWHYVPRSRSGVAFKEMSAAGRAAAHELIKVSLSEVGYTKAVNVMKLEDTLRQLETFGGLLRDPDKYYVSCPRARSVASELSPTSRISSSRSPAASIRNCAAVSSSPPSRRVTS